MGAPRGSFGHTQETEGTLSRGSSAVAFFLNRQQPPSNGEKSTMRTRAQTVRAGVVFALILWMVAAVTPAAGQHTTLGTPSDPIRLSSIRYLTGDPTG